MLLLRDILLCFRVVPSLVLHLNACMPSREAAYSYKFPMKNICKFILMLQRLELKDIVFYDCFYCDIIGLRLELRCFTPFSLVEETGVPRENHGPARNH